MKKDRNNFFSQYGMASMSQNPYMPPQPLENIISNLEKRIQELENKVKNLETINNSTTSNNFNNSMYMI